MKPSKMNLLAARLTLFSALLSTAFLALCFTKNLEMFHGLWTNVELNHFLKFSGIYWALAALLPLVKRGAFSSVFLIVLLGIIAGPSGLGGLAGPTLILLSSYCLGRITLPQLSTRYAIPLGLSVWVCLMGFLVHYRVNYPWVYVLLFLSPIGIQFKSTVAELKSFFSGPRNGFNFKDFSKRLSGEQLYYSLLGYCALILAFFVARPDIGFDALTYHFFPISRLVFDHRASFDIAQNIMVLAPAGGDWLFSIAYLLGGETSAHLIGFLLAILIAYLITNFFQRRNEMGWGMLTAAAFLSTPLVNLETSSLFVENLQTLFILAGTLVFLDFETKGDKTKFIALVILLASSLSVKANSFIYLISAFPFVLWSFVHNKGLKLDAKISLSLMAVLLLGVFGLTPYAFSFYKTGNPLFPFMNAIFKSPDFPSAQSFNNSLFNTPFNWRTAYDITFHSSRFLEGAEGSFGFHFLFFLPLLGFSLPFARTFEKYTLSLITLSFLVLTFHFQSYLRYIYPALPGYLILCSMMVHERTLKTPRTRWLLQFLIVALIGVNLFFRPAASFWFRDFNPSLTFDGKSQKAQMNVAAPERLAVEYLNFKYGENYKLLQLRMPFISLAMGEIQSLTWYHNALSEDFSRTSDLEEIRTLFLKHHITHLCRSAYLTPPTSEHDHVFRRFIDLYSTLETSISSLELRKFNLTKGARTGT